MSDHVGSPEKTKVEIKHRFSGAVLFTAEVDASLKTAGRLIGAAVLAALVSGADLSRADLSGANLSRADLSGANLSGANLSGADLYGADLSRASLSGANLSGADLYGADLSRASLSGANLSGADLYGADLSRANLSRADLSGANLSGANLSGASLSGANLSGADLSGAKEADLTIARTRILSEGDLIGWKKCRNKVIVKLRIPEAAKRSHAFGRKCRAEYADVLEVVGAEFGVSQLDNKIEYHVGQRVTQDGFDLDWTKECSSGVHFFITRIEAENY